MAMYQRVDMAFALLSLTQHMRKKQQNKAYGLVHGAPGRHFSWFF